MIRINSRVALAINTALTVAVIFTAALFLKGWLTTKYASVQPPGAALQEGVQPFRPGRAGSTRAFEDYAAVLSNGLFAPAATLKMIGKQNGQASTGRFVAQMDSLDSVKLVGTVIGSPLINGYALFKDTKTNKQDIFKIGESVFNVGKLSAVKRFSAVIVQSATAYTIHMPETPKSGGSAPSLRRGLRNRPAPGIAGGRGEPKLITRRTGDNEWTVDRRALDEALSDMGKILTQARILPYRVGGKTQGFRLSSVQRSGIFALMGLRSGDILLKVNDYSIDSPEKGIQLLSGLRGESSIELNILRGGKPRKLKYEIR